MASTENCRRQRATMIIGRRTWLFTGTSLVVMGTVAIAVGLVLQQQLHRSKCRVSLDCNLQSTNAKIGIWFGIAIVFYGLLTISAGICRTKALMTMLALLSVLFISFNLTHLLTTEVSIMSSGSNHNNSSQGRGNETNGTGGGGGEPQTIAAEERDHRPSLRFSPEDRIIALEKMLRRGDQETKLDGKSNAMNNNNDDDDHDHSMKFQHQPGANSGYGREVVSPENTEERGHGMDRDHLNRKFKGGKAVRFEAKTLSSADVSSIDATGNKVTTTLASELIETEDESAYESSGSGKGLDNDDDEDENDDGFETAGEEPGRDEYDSYDSDLKDAEGNKTAEEEPLSTFSDWYENEISWTRWKRELGGRGGEGEKDCLEEEENNLQWLIQLTNCLMAVIRFIVLVLSIVLATLILAPCCCYQKGEMEANAKKFNGMQPVTPVAAADKDIASQWQDGDATLLQV